MENILKIAKKAAEEAEFEYDGGYFTFCEPDRIQK